VLSWLPSWFCWEWVSPPSGASPPTSYDSDPGDFNWARASYNLVYTPQTPAVLYQGPIFPNGPPPGRPVHAPFRQPRLTRVADVSTRGSPPSPLFLSDYPGPRSGLDRVPRSIRGFSRGLPESGKQLRLTGSFHVTDLRVQPRTRTAQFFGT